MPETPFPGQFQVQWRAVDIGPGFAGAFGIVGGSGLAEVGGELLGAAGTAGATDAVAAGIIGVVGVAILGIGSA